MSVVVRARGGPLSASQRPRVDAGLFSHLLRHGYALVLVAVATLTAFIAGEAAPIPSLTLIYVLPVVAAASLLGWGPALTASLTGVLAYDFFFTQPIFSLRVSDPDELWAAGLLLVTAAIVSTVAGQARRRTLDVELGAKRVKALEELAEAALAGGGQEALLTASASTLHQILGGPAVVLREAADDLVVRGQAGGAQIGATERSAAKAALEAGTHVHHGAYPFDESSFDFWPVVTPRGRFVVGVDFGGAARPEDADRFVRIVAGYLAARSNG